jgi:site-specific DNA-methyltransferase (adenine-specific)
MKKLYFGDCLDILKELHAEHPDGFIDLVYIDPPFNSKRDYNVLFESLNPSDSTAQKQAFADTWSNVAYLDTLNEIQSLDLDLYQFLQALDNIRVPKGAVAYLTTMAIRIYYIHKVLKKTGSFYLHCDPTMSHYLKLLCDLIFGHQNFRNEIYWKRKYGRTGPIKRFGTACDILLWYSYSADYTFVPQYRESNADYVALKYVYKDANGRVYQLDNLASPNPRPNLTYTYKGYPPPAKGWAISREKMEQWDEEGRLYFPPSPKGRIRRKRFLDELKGEEVQSDWDDILPIGSSAQERLGYPTQKPEALLERIVSTSTKEGDLVADFFCGCGTTIAAAERLNRNWIGVDISHLAIKLIVKRLTDPYRRNQAKFKEILQAIHISGLPKDIASAKELASNTEEGRFGFQDWVVEVMLGGVCNPKKTADGGWDGYLTFNKTEKEKEVVLVEVKSGNVNVKNLREFIQVVDARKAAVGVFVCFEEQVTKPMLLEAKHAGYYDKEHWGDKYDKIQIITVEDLFEGGTVNIPESTMTTFKTAKTGKGKKATQTKLFD